MLRSRETGEGSDCLRAQSQEARTFGGHQPKAVARKPQVVPRNARRGDDSTRRALRSTLRPGYRLAGRFPALPASFSPGKKQSSASGGAKQINLPRNRSTVQADMEFARDSQPVSASHWRLLAQPPHRMTVQGGHPAVRAQSQLAYSQTTPASSDRMESASDSNKADG